MALKLNPDCQLQLRMSVDDVRPVRVGHGRIFQSRPIKTLTRRVFSLALPAFALPATALSFTKGRLAAALAGADFQAIISAMLALKGTDATLAFLRGMKQNVQPYQHSVAMKAVNAGEVTCAVIYH